MKQDLVEVAAKLKDLCARKVRLWTTVNGKAKELNAKRAAPRRSCGEPQRPSGGGLRRRRALDSSHLGLFKLIGASSTNVTSPSTFAG
jgi:hypothetical protein